MMKKLTIKSLILTGIVAFTMLTFAGCNMDSSREKFIGLQLYSVRDAMKQDVEGTISQVGEMGYKFVEAAGYGNGQFYGKSPEDFKELCESNGLQFLGSHAGQNVIDSANWDKTMAWWDEAIQAHADAGVKWIVQPSMGRPGYESLDGLKRFCEYFNAVGEKCNEKGLRFGYHNHANEFKTVLEGKPVYDWMLELTDPDKVMFQLDIYWIIEGGKDPLDYFNRYPGRFELWHLKDKEELGASGNINFEQVFSAREKSGAEYGIVEVEQYNFEPIESVRQSLEFLQQADYVDFYE
jgi:sugar phosphate isomerase/epimerase